MALGKAWIHRLLAQPLDGDEIERASLDQIDKEAPGHNHTPSQWQVVQRMVHTTADFSLVPQVRFSENAIPMAVQALQRAAPLFVDSNMIRSGISMTRLKQVHSAYASSRIACHVSDADVAEQANRHGLPRSLYAMRKARDWLDGAIVVFGNAPVALLELNRMIQEEGIRPALVIGMPVGFVHVLESKEELLTLNVPHIVLEGRRGGSPLAVSVVHALCNLAREEREDRAS
jgi:precorrin isomerase